MKKIVDNLLQAAVLECCSPELAKHIIRSESFRDATVLATDDLVVFSKKDPAAGNDPMLIATHYSSFKAVLHYRLAHALSIDSQTTGARELEDCARLVSARGKLLSGAEIHHRCTIGNRFVLDHGFGTVIGETCTIGNDCYVLGGVTIGAMGIAANPNGKRHPTVGNRVQIGAFARLFGPITIGDDVFIGPHCVIKVDLLPKSIVTVRSQTQIVRQPPKDTDKKPAESL